jgi:hypothetical protein
MLSNRQVIVIAAALAIGATSGCNQSDKQPDKSPVVNGVFVPADGPAKEPQGLKLNNPPGEVNAKVVLPSDGEQKK